MTHQSFPSILAMVLLTKQLLTLFVYVCRHSATTSYTVISYFIQKISMYVGIVLQLATVISYSIQKISMYVGIVLQLATVISYSIQKIFCYR